MDPISFTLGMLGAAAVGKFYAYLIRREFGTDDNYGDNISDLERQFMNEEINKEELILLEKQLRARYGYTTGVNLDD